MRGKGSGVLEERFRFMEEWSSGDWSMAELCRYFGVTRKTGYKWLERYQEGGNGRIAGTAYVEHAMRAALWVTL